MSVAIVFTGGTIASRPDASAGGAVPRLSGAEIIARTPGLSEVADVEAHDWGLMPASHMGFATLLELAALLDRLLEPEQVSGAVLVQGTDAIEETCFAYDLLVRSDKPVVVTGAMRNAAEPDYDGPRSGPRRPGCAGWARWSSSTAGQLPPTERSRRTHPRWMRSSRATADCSPRSRRRACTCASRASGLPCRASRRRPPSRSQ